MKFTIAIVFTSLCFSASCQTWYSGVVVMTDKVVYTGLVSKQSDQLLLLKSSKGIVSALPAHKVSSFRYYDAGEDINRVFNSIEYNNGVVRQNSFYESVVRGLVNVYRKARINQEVLSERDVFDYYLEWNRQLISLNKFRQQVYPALTMNVAGMTRSGNVKKLNPNKKADALQIIKWYNKNYAAMSMAGI